MSLASLFGEPELNEFQKAWYSGDAKRIKEVSEQFKVKKEQVIFKIIDELMVGKKRIMVDEIDEYDQCLINNALSQYPDLIYYAEAMNNHIGSDRKEYLSNQMHFDYLWASIRRAKRLRVKWAKSSSDVDSLMYACISHIFQVSKKRAAEYYRDFSDDQIMEIKRLSKAFAGHDDFLKKHFNNFPKSVTAELQVIVNKW
ncbi:MAG: hypothetical protein [Caudoviricetes sp.]|nr:MAG: hypothetical protein [Caudoviricetes sp.]